MSEEGRDMKRRFIHLSDIHFSNRAGDFGFDPDKQLRQLILQDVARNRQAMGPSDAILVSGDVAFSGKKKEYDDAAVWLESLCEAAGCEREAVLMCPGNHDIDQGVIRANPLIQDGHTAVRSKGTFVEQDAALTSRLVQAEVKKLFYAPLAEYNAFAARYQCSFSADETFAWERDFKLNDGTLLKVRGLNTALLSGLADTQKTLFLGSRAWTMISQVGVEYLVLGHHPPSWLADGREAEKAFEAGARIHLFGHEHDQRVTPGRDWIKLYAGAVNPHRSEPNWKPGYNIVEVWVDTNGGRHLKVEVHAQEWQGFPPQFRPILDVGQKPTFLVTIPLPDLPGTYLQEKIPQQPTVIQAKPSSLNSPSEVPSESRVESAQRFRLAVFRFFRLSLSKKNEVVGLLDLALEDDSSLTDVDRFKLALVRARERNLMNELEEILDRLEN